MLATFSNTQGSAAVQGTQTYGPYGSQQYQQGSMGTSKGYTGQYADPLTGFDYYNARYYDPVAGVFLSADTVQGNASGMNPYAYVGGNPETMSDPTGEMMCSATCGGGGGSGGNGNPTPPPPPPAPSCDWWCQIQNNFNNDVWHPVQHFAQQAQETIIHQAPAIVPAILPILAGVAVGVAAVAAIGSAVYAIWQFTHTDPNWKDVAAGQSVVHPRWVEERRDGKAGLVPSRGHIISSHVNITDSGMQSRARNPRNAEHTATKFYSQSLAQWTVDYALDHMTWAQQLQLLWMRGSPFGRFKSLTLTGNTGVGLGEGYRYNPANGQFTKLTDLSSYKVVIGIDFKTGQPFIITAYPTE